mgnify:CR=1 FL=1
MPLRSFQKIPACLGSRCTRNESSPERSSLSRSSPHPPQPPQKDRNTGLPLHRLMSCRDRSCRDGDTTGNGHWRSYVPDRRRRPGTNGAFSQGGEVLSEPRPVCRPSRCPPSGSSVRNGRQGHGAIEPHDSLRKRGQVLRARDIIRRLRGTGASGEVWRHGSQSSRGTDKYKSQNQRKGVSLQSPHCHDSLRPHYRSLTLVHTPQRQKSAKQLSSMHRGQPLRAHPQEFVVCPGLRAAASLPIDIPSSNLFHFPKKRFYTLSII